MLYFMGIISTESATSSFTQRNKRTKSQSDEHQATASAKIVIKLKVSIEFSRHFFLNRTIFPLDCTLFSRSWHYFLLFFVFCFTLLSDFRYFLYFFLANSTKSEKSISTNSLASPPSSSSNGAGSITQIFPLKLADKKVSLDELSQVKMYIHTDTHITR